MRQQSTQGNYILLEMKMATEHSKVVFIAILNYSREQWFCHLVVYWKPPPPSPFPLLPLPPLLLCLFQTLIINEAKQGAFPLLHFLIRYQ